VYISSETIAFHNFIAATELSNGYPYNLLPTWVLPHNRSFRTRLNYCDPGVLVLPPLDLSARPQPLAEPWGALRGYTSAPFGHLRE